MRKHALLGGLAAAAIIGSATLAHADATINFSERPTSYTTPTGQSLIVDFDNTDRAGATDTFSKTTGSADGQYAAPNLGTPDNTFYGYVLGGGSATLQLLTAVSSLSLEWGSVDTFNTIDFFNGTTQVGTVNGSQVPGNDSGSQTAGGTAIVNVNFSTPVDRAVFSSTQNAFEVDNIAVGATNISAAPEPGAWALMLGGVAFLGLALRRRVRRDAISFAA